MVRGLLVHYEGNGSISLIGHIAIDDDLYYVLGFTGRYSELLDLLLSVLMVLDSWLLDPDSKGHVVFASVLNVLNFDIVVVSFCQA